MSTLDGAWVGNYRFPFSDIWKTILTVDGIGPSAVVSTAEITIHGLSTSIQRQPAVGEWAILSIHS
jgi:hypothetical protein